MYDLSLVARQLKIHKFPYPKKVPGIVGEKLGVRLAYMQTTFARMVWFAAELRPGRTVLFFHAPLPILTPSWGNGSKRNIPLLAGGHKFLYPRCSMFRQFFPGNIDVAGTVFF